MMIRKPIQLIQSPDCEMPREAPFTAQACRHFTKRMILTHLYISIFELLSQHAFERTAATFIDMIKDGDFCIHKVNTLSSRLPTGYSLTSTNPNAVCRLKAGRDL